MNSLTLKSLINRLMDSKKAKKFTVLSSIIDISSRDIGQHLPFPGSSFYYTQSTFVFSLPEKQSPPWPLEFYPGPYTYGAHHRDMNVEFNISFCENETTVLPPPVPGISYFPVTSINIVSRILVNYRMFTLDDSNKNVDYSTLLTFTHADEVIPGIIVDSAYHPDFWFTDYEPPYDTNNLYQLTSVIDTIINLGLIAGALTDSSSIDSFIDSTNLAELLARTLREGEIYTLNGYGSFLEYEYTAPDGNVYLVPGITPGPNQVPIPFITTVYKSLNSYTEQPGLLSPCVPVIFYSCCTSSRFTELGGGIFLNPVDIPDPDLPSWDWDLDVLIDPDYSWPIPPNFSIDPPIITDDGPIDNLNDILPDTRLFRRLPCSQIPLFIRLYLTSFRTVIRVGSAFSASSIIEECFPFDDDTPDVIEPPFDKSPFCPVDYYCPFPYYLAFDPVNQSWYCKDLNYPDNIPIPPIPPVREIFPPGSNIGPKPVILPPSTPTDNQPRIYFSRDVLFNPNVSIVACEWVQVSVYGSSNLLEWQYLPTVILYQNVYSASSQLIYANQGWSIAKSYNGYREGNYGEFWPDPYIPDEYYGFSDAELVSAPDFPYDTTPGSIFPLLRINDVTGSAVVFPAYDPSNIIPADKNHPYWEISPDDPFFPFMEIRQQVYGRASFGLEIAFYPLISYQHGDVVLLSIYNAPGSYLKFFTNYTFQSIFGYTPGLHPDPLFQKLFRNRFGFNRLVGYSLGSSPSTWKVALQNSLYSYNSATIPRLPYNKSNGFHPGIWWMFESGAISSITYVSIPAPDKRFINISLLYNPITLWVEPPIDLPIVTNSTKLTNFILKLLPNDKVVRSFSMELPPVSLNPNTFSIRISPRPFFSFGIHDVILIEIDYVTFATVSEKVIYTTYKRMFGTTKSQAPVLIDSQYKIYDIYDNKTPANSHTGLANAYPFSGAV